MRSLRRAAPALLASVLALSPATALAQPPGIRPPGNYQNSSTEADFFAISPLNDNLEVSVGQGTATSHPLGGAVTVTHTATLNINYFSVDSFGNPTGGSGCYLLPDGAFTFSLTAAHLHADITPASATCGGPQSMPDTFSIDVTWTASGPVSTSNRGQTSDCVNYHMTETIIDNVVGTSGSGTLTPIFGETFSGAQTGVLRTDAEAMHVQGVPPDNCPAPPGATPGGIGPPPQGVYRDTSLQAGISTYNPDGMSVGVFLSDDTHSAQPVGGPATSSTDLELRFSIQDWTQGLFVAGCFVISPADFTFNGVNSASVNLSIPDTTQAQTCFGGGTNLPPSLTIKGTWTGTGPIETDRFRGTFSCLTYHDAGQGLDISNLANVTITLPEILGDTPITSDQGSLTSSNDQLNAGGIKQPACHV